ncbi:MAG: hypothetical protein JXD18_01025 [Anaerolineae bacterium]|nr:hypothetical protein [Anaerolineae bacterium]
MGHDLALLLANKARLIRNGWRQRFQGGSWRQRLAPVTVVVWLGLLGYGAFSGFQFLRDTLGTAAAPVASEALGGVFLGGMMLVLVNGMRQMFDTFFLSGGLALLLSTPLSRRAVFVDRFLEGIADNAVYAGVMVLPPGAAFLYAFGAPWFAYIWLVVSFLLLLVGLTAISILLDMAIVRLIPAARARQVLVSVNMVLMLGIIILYNAFSARIVQPDRAIAFLASEHISRQAYLPTQWMAQSLVSLTPGYTASFWLPAGLLVGTSVALAVVAVWVAGRLYARGWGAAQESARRRRTRTGGTAPSTRGGSPLLAFLTKDLRYFLRDTRSWGMLLFGLVILAFFGLSYARDMASASELMIAGAGVLLPGMGGLLSARWMLTVFAQEGEAWWVIQSSPLREVEVFYAKFVLNYGLALLYNSVAVALFGLLSPVPAGWLPAAMLLVAILALGTTAIGLAVAAWRANVRNPQLQRRDTLGYYTMMGIVAGYVGLPVLALVALDDAPWLAAQLPGLMRLPAPTLLLLLAAFYLPVTAALWVGMRAWAVSALQKLRVE